MKSMMSWVSLLIVCLTIRYAVWAGARTSPAPDTSLRVSSLPDNSAEGLQSIRDDPVPMGEIAKDQLPEAKAKLRKLEQSIDQIAEKLAQMKAAAATLRASIAVASTPGDKVYRSAEALFADMPQDAFPKAGPEGGLERAATRKWLKEKFTPSRRIIEFPVTVVKVSIQGDGPFRVRVYTDAEIEPLTYGGLLLEKYNLGDQPCPLFLENILGCISLNETLKQPRICAGWVTGSARGIPDFYLSYEPCTAEEAGLLRSFKGRTVKLRGVVERARLWDEDQHFRRQSMIHRKRVAISVCCRQLSINGFLPAAAKAANNK